MIISVSRHMIRTQYLKIKSQLKKYLIAFLKEADITWKAPLILALNNMTWISKQGLKI